ALFAVVTVVFLFSFFFSSRRRHTRSKRDWSSDVCSSDLELCGFDYDIDEYFRRACWGNSSSCDIARRTRNGLANNRWTICAFWRFFIFITAKKSAHLTRLSNELNERFTYVCC